MSDVIISVENLGKKYRITHQAEQGSSYKSLREVVTTGTSNLLRRVAATARKQKALRFRSSREEFWALKDVSFEVNRGQAIGIIGRNGAGKSTLLKLLSRITEPSEGRISLKGRVASLLEVGTGFHPELTGRENIYLNGAVMGMTKSEIRRKFDEIVAFAGVEKFLDTPVKRFSSGMYVRLAFAVAAHLEPEILVVDEVLAVGDAEFQKKCLGKMQDVSRGGRTVLFVSHNANAVESLCGHIIHLDGGQVVQDTADVRGAIARYLSAGVETTRCEWRNPGAALKNRWFHPSRFFVGDVARNVVSGAVRNDQRLFVYIEGDVDEEDVALQVGYALHDETGALLYWSTQTDLPQDQWPKIRKGWNQLRSPFPMRLLNQGGYRLDLIMSLYFREWISQAGRNAPSINLTIQGGLSDSPYWMVQRPGVMAPVFGWTVESDGNRPEGDGGRLMIRTDEPSLK